MDQENMSLPFAVNSRILLPPPIHRFPTIAAYPFPTEFLIRLPTIREDTLTFERSSSVSSDLMQASNLEVLSRLSEIEMNNNRHFHDSVGEDNNSNNSNSSNNQNESNNNKKRKSNSQASQSIKKKQKNSEPAIENNDQLQKIMTECKEVTQETFPRSEQIFETKVVFYQDHFIAEVNIQNQLRKSEVRDGSKRSSTQHNDKLRNMAFNERRLAKKVKYGRTFWVKKATEMEIKRIKASA